MRHVLRVASSLDSMVVGEPQILGQAKDAYRAAVECGAAGPILGRLFQHAFATAKRVRSETRIAERPVSVARVAVDLAAQIFESFAEQARAAGRRGRDDRAGAARAARRGARGDRGRQPHRRARRAARGRSSARPRTGSTSCRALLADADVVLTSIGGDEPWLDARRRASARCARGAAARCS